jgi:hypothetical protein
MMREVYWEGQQAALRVQRIRTETGQGRLCFKPPASENTPTVTVTLTKAEAQALNTWSFMIREEEQDNG